MYNIFLSHAVEDDELAGRVASLLRNSDIQVFATGPGTPTGMWSEEVRAALEESEHFWLLLTGPVLDRSVYVHHEFGYFFGYHRGNEPSKDVRVMGKRLRYLVRGEDRRRPGMYQHFQDFPIENFDDPVGIARIIAKEIGREFAEPENPIEFRMSSSGWTGLGPDGLESLEIISPGASAAPDYSYGIRTIDVLSPRPIFNISAVTWHPLVNVWPLRPLSQVGSKKKETLSLRVEWAKGTSPPPELQDSFQRRFARSRPRDPGLPWEPLYITFETQSGQTWAAVAYMRVEKQAHGHPETHLLPGPNPYGWVKGHKGQS